VDDPAPIMASILLRRLAKNCCLDQHRSLPLTTIWWEHTRGISDDRSLDNDGCNRISGASSILISDTQKSEVLILQRRQELLSLSSGKWRMWEEVWLDRLEEIIKFNYKHGRLPIRGAKDKKELSSAQWMNNQRTSRKIPLLSDPSWGSWIDNQRKAYRAWKEPEKYKPVTNCMDEERAAKLEAVPGWKWNIRD
jgi:hypothetical protein